MKDKNFSVFGWYVYYRLKTIFEMWCYKMYDPSPPCHTMSRFVDPPPPTLTCDVIYGCPLSNYEISRTNYFGSNNLSYVSWRNMVLCPGLVV